MKKDGKDKNLPNSLIKKVQKLQSEDFEEMGEEQLADALETIETLTAIANNHLDSTEFVEDEVEFVAVKCQCVHGECNEGHRECAKCYSGWKGRMCDISTSSSRN